MEMYTYFAAMGAGAFLGWHFARMVTKYPSEDVMMNRLIVAATERRMLGVTRKDIEEKIETRVQANLNTAK